MQKLLIVLVVTLCLPIMANAGWLSDKLKKSSENIVDKLINDASDTTYQKTKKSTKDALEKDIEEEEYDNEAVEEPPPPWAETRTATKKKKRSSKSSMRTDLHFSADTIITDPESSPTPVQGKMFVDGTKMRWDMSTAEGDMSTIITGSEPDDEIYTVIHGEKMYMMSKIRNAEEDFWTVLGNADNPCEGYRSAKEVGSKTLIGRKTIKWECNDSEDEDLSESMTVWLDNKLQVPIRYVASEGYRYEIIKLSESKPPANTFTVPKGYRALSFGIGN